MGAGHAHGVDGSGWESVARGPQRTGEGVDIEVVVLCVVELGVIV